MNSGRALLRFTVLGPASPLRLEEVKVGDRAVTLGFYLARLRGEIRGRVTVSGSGAERLFNMQVNLIKAEHEKIEECRQSLAQSQLVMESTLTDQYGKFLFGGLSPGTYGVLLSHPTLKFDSPGQCVSVQGSNVSGVDFTTAKPSFLSTACPVSGQERRLQSSWLKEFLDYVRAVLSYVVPYKVYIPLLATSAQGW